MTKKQIIELFLDMLSMAAVVWLFLALCSSLGS